MKTLIIGFIVFLGWTGMSSYFYVCKIKGLCSEHETTLVSTIKVKDAYAADSLPDTLVAKPAMPDNPFIYFAFDKSEFISDSNLSESYEASISYVLRNSDAGLHIIGYTDSKGSDEYNLALGLRRAKNVMDYFESKGVPAEKITIESQGEKEPSENNSSEEGRAKNRRAAVTVKN